MRLFVFQTQISKDDFKNAEEGILKLSPGDVHHKKRLLQQQGDVVTPFMAVW